MQVGLNILGAENLYGGAIRPVLELAARADRAGIDVITTGDHLGFNATAHAERRRTHNFRSRWNMIGTSLSRFSPRSPR